MALTVNTDQLMNDARCIDKCIPDGEKMSVLISVLYQLLQNGTGGGGGGGSGASFLSGTGTPVGSVTPTIIGQTYLDKNTSNLWISTGLTNASWVELVEPTESAMTLNTGANTIDWSLASLYSGTLAASTTFTFSNGINGQTMVVRLTNTGGNFTVTWPGAVKWPGGLAPVMTVGAHTDIYTFVQSNGVIYGIANQNY
jgi:hypothetical protein